MHRLLHPDTWHRLPEKSNNDLVKEEKNHNTNKMEEDDICESVKDEVDSDHGQDFAQYSDWEDDTSLLDQPPVNKKASSGRKRGRPRKIQPNIDDEDTDTDNGDPSWDEKQVACSSKPEGADYLVEAVLERKVVTGKRGKSHKVGHHCWRYKSVMTY